MLQMYPAPIRSTAHGISAATGKVGSICVVVWLNYLGNRNKFWITWPVALLGACICWVFVADNTGLDLAEQVRINSISVNRADMERGPELSSSDDAFVPCMLHQALSTTATLCEPWFPVFSLLACELQRLYFPAAASNLSVLFVVACHRPVCRIVCPVLTCSCCVAGAQMVFHQEW